MKYEADCTSEMRYSVTACCGGNDRLCTDSFAEAVAFANTNKMYVFDNAEHRWIYDGYRDELEA